MQCDQSTFYYSWSRLDLSLPLSIEETVNCLRDLISIYCSDRVHTVSEYADTKETVTRPRLWEGLLVHLHYNKKIEGG